jgi:peroxiredoxin
MARTGSYRLLVSGYVAILTAVVASARDTPSPNDHFTNATVLTGVTNFVIADNADATSEPGEPNHAGVTGGKSLWWSWQAPITGTFFVTTGGSSFDTLLAVYVGDSISNLEVVAENDDGDGFGVVVSYLVFRAIAGEMYRIAVDGFNGTTGAVRLSMGRVGEPAPFWSIVDLDGREVHATDFPPKVLVIDFWETTCTACVDELPYLRQLYDNFTVEGLAFFGVAKDANSNDVRRFVDSHGIPYGIAMRTEEMEDAFGGDVALPTKFIIDRENMLVRVFFGGADYATYEKLLKPLLRGSKQVPVSVRRQSNAFVIAWPATEFGYDLESTATLGGTNWAAAALPVVTTNGQNTVTVPASTGAQFFRLRKTPAH